MSRVDLRDEWRERMESFASSGLSQRAWCEREGIGLARFGYWRRRLAEPATGQAEVAAWCPVELLTEPRSGTGLTVRTSKVG